MGPYNQLKKMFASTRIVATIVVLVMIVLTIIAAVVVSANFVYMCTVCRLNALFM